MPAITRWSRSSVCSGRGASSRAARSSGGSGHASGPSVAIASSRSTSPSRSTFTHAACLVPNSRSRSSRPSSIRMSRREVRSRSDARLSYSCSRPADIRWMSTCRSPATSTTRCLPMRRTPSIGRAVQRVQRRVERLQRVQPRGQRRLDRRAPQRRVEPARGDLDLGQLRHPTEGSRAGEHPANRPVPGGPRARTLELRDADPPPARRPPPRLCRMGRARRRAGRLRARPARLQAARPGGGRVRAARAADPLDRPLPARLRRLRAPARARAAGPRARPRADAGSPGRRAREHRRRLGRHALRAGRRAGAARSASTASPWSAPSPRPRRSTCAPRAGRCNAPPAARC